MPPLIRHPIIQHAYFVNDLDEGCMRWVDVMGAGPFFVNRHHVGERHTHRGEPFKADVSYAFGQSGPTHIQLIAQYDDAPSIYRDMFARGEEGLHHIAVLVPESDLPEEIARFEAAGFPSVSELWGGADVAYIDTRPALGCFLELHGENPTITRVFESWRVAHENWDGVTDPIREAD